MSSDGGSSGGTAPPVRRFDHIGITVSDLEEATAFFVGLGFEIEGGPSPIEGAFIDTVTGIPDARSEILMLRPPDGGTCLELSSFAHPDHTPGNPHALANELGLRSIAFEVDDVPSLVEKLAADGYGLIGGIGEYEDYWRMAYVRGPDGITVALAQRIG
ncbi:glyoxalase [Sinomonas cellulolyticus]|uniref:VOC family protein n=1 Tax=Sinomonas cellulolyticus TaxID=2801916 RepID=A0ABS1K389_9MICC|nr:MULTISPECIES: VOC family protein [Sinomonas]MBL0706146.1 VOC family protein [Sinomonas cellulolyticus]GHG55194.1 glyoxalase [Sinomonas sp. KCTC 49339]